MANSDMYKYCKREDLPDNKQAYAVSEMPISVGLTDYHYYLLFQESLTIVNRVTQQLIKSVDLKGGSVVDMSYDRMNVLLWVFTNNNLYRMDLRREDTQVWKLLTEKKRYR
jgi:hypothetical protein